MRHASQVFDTEARQRVNQAVAQAEGKTSAEIVPVVATASGRYDRPEDVFGMWVAVAAMVATWLALPNLPDEPGNWGALPAWVHVACMILAVVAGFVLGAVVAGHVGWLRRLLTPRKQMQEEVTAAAHGRFFDSRIHHTQGATGVVVYISLFERMASIIADRAVIEALGQETLDQLVDELTARLRAETTDQALIQTISDLGEHLSTPLPRAQDDRNELPDGLVLID